MPEDAEKEIVKLLNLALEQDRLIIKNIDTILDAYREKKRRIKLVDRAGMRLVNAIKRGASQSHKRNLSHAWSEAKRYRDLYIIV